MLILSRKSQERIFIGNIRLTVVAVHGRKTKIGIDAPRDVPILRGELQHFAKEKPAAETHDRTAKSVTESTTGV